MKKKDLDVYLVGGAVRDKLLGLKVVERDWVVVGATPAQMLDYDFQKVGKDFPVFLHPETKEEYALARVERKTSQGYYGFSCDHSITVTLEEDLLRRDLTINAMAEDPNGNIIDPYNGRQDLDNRMLRHVSPAFVEDPVRVLRVARFAAKLAAFGFTVADDTLQLMQEMVDNGEIDHLVPERVWKEFERALQLTDPKPFIETLRQCGALKKLFPALDCLWGIPQSEKWHPEIDTGIHIMMALDKACALSDDPKIRFAALCHDLGKGLTPKNELPSHKRHEERGIVPIKEWCKKYKVPNAFKDLAVYSSRFHLNVHNVTVLKNSTIVKILEQMDAFRNPERFENVLIVCEADAIGRGGFEKKEDQIYSQRDYFKKCFAAASSVKAQQFLDQGFSGPELGKKMHEARVQAVKACRSEQDN